MDEFEKLTSIVGMYKLRPYDPNVRIYEFLRRQGTKQIEDIYTNRELNNNRAPRFIDLAPEILQDSIEAFDLIAKELGALPDNMYITGIKLPWFRITRKENTIPNVSQSPAAGYLTTDQLFRLADMWYYHIKPGNKDGITIPRSSEPIIQEIYQNNLISRTKVGLYTYENEIPPPRIYLDFLNTNQESIHLRKERS